MKNLSKYAAIGAALTVLVTGACSSVDLSKILPSEDSTSVTVGGTSPLANPDGTQPGLAAIGQTDYAAARQEIDKVQTKGRGPKTGYTRSEFGQAWTDDVNVPFGHNGCDTRNDILDRDMNQKTFRDNKKCVLATGVIEDPYTGKTIEFTRGQNTSTAVQIDHVIPLSYSWQMGTQYWSPEKRQNFANDPLNLLAVDGPANGSKSDSGPASWLPPNKAIRCSYSVRIAQVALKYDLAVTKADKDMMLRQCS